MHANSGAPAHEQAWYVNPSNGQIYQVHGEPNSATEAPAVEPKQTGMGSEELSDEAASPLESVAIPRACRTWKACRTSATSSASAAKR